MSDQQRPPTPPVPPAPEVPAGAAHERRARLVGGLCLLFAVLGAGWFVYDRLFLAGTESTDDAYVAGNLVRVSPEIAGSVTEILADNTQPVAAGQLLVRLDDTDARLALDGAREALAGAVREVRELMAESDRLAAEVGLRRVELAKAAGDYERRRDKKTAFSVSAEELSHARDNVTLAEAALRAAEHALAGNRARLRDTPLEDQPPVRARAHQLREAWLALQRCEIVSPTAGYVARRAVQVGARVAPGTPLMTVVPLAEVWVDANFKEGQLKNMRAGQPARVRADLYGSSVTYTGTVAGFTAGTGSAFSLLPPENATGNWIKVVQRVPVKIVLDKDQLAQTPLLVGLSCTVWVEVEAGDASPLTAPPPAGEIAGAAFRTTAFERDTTAIETEITAIIAANSRLAEPAGSPAYGQGRPGVAPAGTEPESGSSTMGGERP